MAENREIAVTDLQKYRIMIGTPMYGGNCSGFYMNSCIALANHLNQCGIGFGFNLLFNESLITRARNYIVDGFLNSEHDFTHLLFIDSDIEFDARAVTTMLAIAHANPDKHVITAPYPKKSISWEKVREAVNQGKADENPFLLENYAGDFIIGLKDKSEKNLNEIIEVSEAGTGFMLISRHAFNEFKKAFPQYMYIPDHARSKDFNGDREIMQYFQAEIDPNSKRYLSEDYWFCYKLAEIGINTYMVPWINLNHIGTTKFVGNLPAVASLNVSLTTDKKEAKKLHELQR